MSGTKEGALKREEKFRFNLPDLKTFLISNSKLNKKGCWIWKNGGKRYGYIDWKNKRWGAHVLSFKCFNGYVPKYTLHHCDVKRCINPEHLYDGTSKQNNDDFRRRNPNKVKNRTKLIKIAMKQFWNSMSKIKRRKFIDERARKQYGIKSSR